MREDPIPEFRANRAFSKLLLFAALVACILLSYAFRYHGLGSLILSVVILCILLVYAEVLKDQIIEAIRGNSSTLGGSGKSGASAGGPSGNQTQKEQS